jgi:hypothetical protein
VQVARQRCPLADCTEAVSADEEVGHAKYAVPRERSPPASAREAAPNPDICTRTIVPSVPQWNRKIDTRPRMHTRAADGLILPARRGNSHILHKIRGDEMVQAGEERLLAVILTGLTEKAHAPLRAEPVVASCIVGNERFVPKSSCAWRKFETTLNPAGSGSSPHRRSLRSILPSQNLELWFKLH